MKPLKFEGKRANQKPAGDVRDKWNFGTTKAKDLPDGSEPIRVGSKWASTARVDSDESRPHGSAHGRKSGAKQPTRSAPSDKGAKWQPHNYMGTTSGGGVENAQSQASAGKKFSAKSKISQNEANRPNVLESYAGSSGSGAPDSNAPYGSKSQYLTTSSKQSKYGSGK